MSQIQCFLIDDEPPALELLEKYISLIDQLEIAGTSHSAVKAFGQLKEQEIDLLFLDIQMPVLNGIDFIKTLTNPPAIILTTAYREYALDGYDLDIIDYLLKPISFDRFLKAVDRYRNRSQLSNTDHNNLPKANDHIFFNVNRTHHKVLFDEIQYIESLKDYVRIHMKNDNLVVKGNIGSILKLLPKEKFVRVHRSFVVALLHIKSYSQSEVDVAGHRLPIGVSYRETMRSVLSK